MLRFAEQVLLLTTTESQWGDLNKLGANVSEIVIFLGNFGPNTQESHSEFAGELFAMGLYVIFQVRDTKCTKLPFNTMNTLRYYIYIQHLSVASLN